MMDSKTFDGIVESQLGKIRSTLIRKAGEYDLEEDRLGFFKRAAALTGQTPKQALYGFMLKHIVSVTDMCMDGESHPKELWQEKATDIMDYLILLMGLVEEEQG